MLFINTITRTNFQNLLNPQNVCSMNVVFERHMPCDFSLYNMKRKRFLLSSCNSQLTPITQQQLLQQQQQKWTSLFSIELTTTKYRRQNLKFNIHYINWWNRPIMKTKTATTTTTTNKNRQTPRHELKTAIPTTRNNTFKSVRAVTALKSMLR